MLAPLNLYETEHDAQNAIIHAMVAKTAALCLSINRMCLSINRMCLSGEFCIAWRLFLFFKTILFYSSIERSV